MTPGCTTIVVAFDFDKKIERTIDPADVDAAMRDDLFVWIDVQVDDVDAARQTLKNLGLIEERSIDDALAGTPTTRQRRDEKSLTLVMTGCRMAGSNLQQERLDVIIGVQYLLTIHRGSVQFLNCMRKEYQADFVQHANTPSFLVYELWDHAVENYIDVQRSFEERVEQLQEELVHHMDDEMFARVSALGTDILRFRNVLIPARGVLSELATRKSIFVNPATQLFLGNMAAVVETVLQDLIADREILSETLNLNMSMVTHRTNEVVKRLTIVSVIFLPLTFLCGVYGMNFELFPELEWPWGYPMFWGAAVLITISSVLFMRYKKLL